jgi:hypothetical protein
MRQLFAPGFGVGKANLFKGNLKKVELGVGGMKNSGAQERG